MRSDSERSKKPAGGRAKGAKAGGFTAEELSAMRDRVKELRATARRGKGADPAEAEREVLAKIATFPAHDRALGERFHAIVRANAPGLVPRLWYGMPAYANQTGHVICFFRGAYKFKTRYATFGFSDEARLDDGMVWPTDFALVELAAADEAKIAALVRKAVG